MRVFAHLGLILLLAGCYADNNVTAPGVNQKAIAAFQQAREAIASGDADAALRHAGEGWVLDQDYLAGAWVYACLLGKSGDYEEGIAVCQDLLRRHPECIQGHLLEGILWDRSGNRESANRAYDRAISGFASVSATAEPATHLYEAVTVFLRHGKLEGVGAINRVLDQYPEYELARYVKSCIQVRDRDFLLRWFSESQGSASEEAHRDLNSAT